MFSVAFANLHANNCIYGSDINSLIAWKSFDAEKHIISARIMGLPLCVVLCYLSHIMMEIKKYSMIQPSDEPSVCNKSQVGMFPFHICAPTASGNIMRGLCNKELIGNKIGGSNIAMLLSHALYDIIFMSIFTCTFA